LACFQTPALQIASIYLIHDKTKLKVMVEGQILTGNGIEQATSALAEPSLEKTW
jgi:hypothetical protein